MQIEVAKLKGMLEAEMEMAKAWDDMTPKERQVYLKAHPSSRHGNHIKPGGIKPNFGTRLEAKGWKKSGNNTWKHSNGKTLSFKKGGGTHTHHIEITHKNGDVSTHKSNRGSQIAYLIHHYAKPPSKGAKKSASTVPPKVAAKPTVKRDTMKKTPEGVPLKREAEDKKKYAPKVADKPPSEGVRKIQEKDAIRDKRRADHINRKIATVHKKKAAVPTPAKKPEAPKLATKSPMKKPAKPAPATPAKAVHPKPAKKPEAPKPAEKKVKPARDDEW